MRCSTFKYTTSDWSPSYKIDGRGGDAGFVEVIFTQTGPNPPCQGQWRVCAWGKDDCGVEKDFNNESEAWGCYIQVIGLEDVTMEELKKRGFVAA